MLQLHLPKLMAVSASVLLMSASGSAFAQINGSQHDLASGGNDNNEVCVYCHTPHGANTAVEAPLWNKVAGTAPGAYSTYDNTTIDGDILPVGSVSIACLTCHDGTQARDAVINAPGRGMGSGNTDAGLLALTGTPVPNLGTDLTNDHPIGIQYGGFTPTAATTQIDPDFKNTTNGLSSATILGRPRWWVDTTIGTAGVRDKTDMILYTRLNPNGAEDQPFVECASCHDPHIAQGANNLAFMRLSNSDSAVCLACHVK